MKNDDRMSGGLRRPADCAETIRSYQNYEKSLRRTTALRPCARDARSFRVRRKPRFGLLQRKGILVIKNVGTYPSAFSHVHDVEAAMPLSVSCLFQTKAIELSDAIDALFLCVSHAVAPVEPYGSYVR